MAWTAPRTADASEVWGSADWNTYVRDNLLETFPGKASAALQYFVATGINTIATRTAGAATTLTSETRTSATYGDLSGGATGPAVTVNPTGTAVLVMWTASHSNGSADIDTWTSVAVSGATTISASDQWGTRMDGVAANNANRFGMAHLFTVNTGSNTFTMKYRSASGTATYVNRHIIAVPL